MHTEKRPTSYLPLVALALLVLTGLSRGMGYIYSTMATDIAYAELPVRIIGILVEVLNILRTVTGYAAILFAMARWDRDTPAKVRCGPAAFVVVWVMDILDYASRYLVDIATASITDMEMVAMLWLLLQLSYSTILLLVCWCLGTWLTHPKSGAPKSLDVLLTCSVLVLAGSRLLLEGYYILEFLSLYANVTTSEISAMVGQVLYTLVLYGGVAWVAIMAVSATLKGMYGTSDMT